MVDTENKIMHDNNCVTIFDNVMTERNWLQIEQEFDDYEKTQAWLLHTFQEVDEMHSEKTMSGFGAGHCVSTQVSSEVKDLLTEILADVIPKRSGGFIANYFYNYPYSQLNPHSHLGTGKFDKTSIETRPWFATLYLMREWHAEWGGLFLWRPSTFKKDEWAAITPHGNKLVMGTNLPPVQHMMSMISPFARVRRRSIQINGQYSKYGSVNI